MLDCMLVDLLTQFVLVTKFQLKEANSVPHVKMEHTYTEKLVLLIAHVKCTEMIQQTPVLTVTTLVLAVQLQDPKTVPNVTMELT